MRQKTINDYYEQMFAEFPLIPKRDIKRILQYGYKSFYLHNSYGGDVILSRNTFWLYSGRLMKDSLKWFEYYVKKLVIKIRVLYKRNKTNWDGYYYFALNRNQYKEYKAQIKKRGRPKKWFTFKNIKLFKIFEECRIAQGWGVAILRMKYLVPLGTTAFHREIKTNRVEFVMEKEPTKFVDTMTSMHEYDMIKNRKYKLK